MTEMLEKLQKMDSGKFNGGAVALLTIVLFFYGKQISALPDTVADMARTQALLVYRIEQLERAIDNDRAAVGPTSSLFSCAAPSLPALAHSLAPLLPLPQPLPVPALLMLPGALDELPTG